LPLGQAIRQKTEVLFIKQFRKSVNDFFVF
jgi:hypothetical protein